jgi:predicted RND superfamily exporter protein
VGGALLVSALATAGVAQLQFSQNHLMWFPEDDAIRRGTELVDSSFAGAMTAEVIIDTGIEGGVYEPEFLERVSRATEHAEQLRHGDIAVGKAISIVDIIEETHQALNENDPHFRTIPEERGAVAQLLLLFENTGAEDLMDFTDAPFREARISLRVTHSDAIAYIPFLDRLKSDLTSIFGDGNRIQLTGLMTVLTEGLSAIVSSTARSYVIAFAAILPTMLVMIGNRQRGLLSVIPNLFPVLLVLGVMGWAGIGIDASTLMVGGIILGLAVDDTIHFFHNYERVFRQSGDVRRSIKETLETAGLAIVTTSLVLAAGFSSFGFAYMTNVSTLGFLLAFATLAALAGDLFLVPALLILVCRDDKVEKVPQYILLESERRAWRKTPLTSAEPSISLETVKEREKADERTRPPPLA